MPVLVWFVYIELNDCTKFIGVSKGGALSHEEFRKKAVVLCDLMGWPKTGIHSIHSYVDAISDEFKLV